jgi:hypothetical protein
VTGPCGFPAGRIVGDSGAAGGPQTEIVAVVVCGAAPTGAQVNVIVEEPGSAPAPARNVKRAGPNAGGRGLPKSA